MIITPAPTTDRHIHPLRSDYVEACWTPIIGTSGVTLLRLLPSLWLESVPAVIEDLEVAHLLGRPKSGAAASHVAGHVAGRVARFTGGDWCQSTGNLDVPPLVPSLTATQLARVPDRTRAAHVQLLAAAAAR